MKPKLARILTEVNEGRRARDDGTYQDTAATVGEKDGHGVEVAVSATCICDSGGDGEGAEDGVKEDAVGSQGSRARLRALAEDIVQQHPSGLLAAREFPRAPKATPASVRVNKKTEEGWPRTSLTGEDLGESRGPMECRRRPRGHRRGQ